MADRPPMCPGTWLLGNARALLDDTAGALTDGYRHCGPVFRVRAAWRTYTIVAGDEASDFMALGLGPAHLSRERLFGPIAREFGRADLILKEIGPAHARLRPALALPYSRQVASAHVPAMIETVRREVRAWPTGSTWPAVRQTKRLAFEVYRLLLGNPIVGFRDCLRMTDYLMNVAARQLPPVVLRLPWYRRSHTRTYAAITALVRARHDRQADDGPPTIIDALWSARDATGTPFSEDEVVSYAAYGIGASIGYVGRLTAFMLYEILRDPGLHEALRREVRGGMGRGLGDAAAVRSLSLLRAVYDETLRLHSLAIGLPFDVVADIDFLGHRLRRGDSLVVSPVPTSYDPARFPDPQRFDAARCQPPRNEHRRPGACLPFGLGDRRCAAMGLVELMSMVVVGTLLHERDLAMQPRGYRLRRSVHPLPSPNRRFRFRVVPATATTTEPAASGASRTSEEDLLSAFPGHDEPAVQEALAHAARRTFAAGAVVIREGDAADAFHLIERGDVVVSRTDAPGDGVLARLGPGQWFGEAGLLLRAPRNATVTAGSEGVVTRVVDGDAFLAMVASSDLVGAEIGHLLRRRAATARLMEAAPLLSAATAAAVLPEFSSRRYAPGAAVITEGEAAEEFFVLLAGRVEVSRHDAQGRSLPLATLGPGDYFGEMGLLHGAPRNATVRALDAVEVLVTGRAGFDRLLAEGGGAAGALAQAMLSRTERLAS